MRARASSLGCAHGVHYLGQHIRAKVHWPSGQRTAITPRTDPLGQPANGPSTAGWGVALGKSIGALHKARGMTRTCRCLAGPTGELGRPGRCARLDHGVSWGGLVRELGEAARGLGHAGGTRPRSGPRATHAPRGAGAGAPLGSPWGFVRTPFHKTRQAPRQRGVASPGFGRTHTLHKTSCKRR